MCGWPCRRGGCARWKSREVVCKGRPANGAALRRNDGGTEHLNMLDGTAPAGTAPPTTR